VPAFVLAGPLGEALGEQVGLAAGTALATLALAAGLLVRETRDLRRITWGQAPVVLKKT
jgi:hypothetical protein